MLKTSNKNEINDMLHVGHIWSQILPTSSMSGIFTYILAYHTWILWACHFDRQKPKHQNHQPPTLVGPYGQDDLIRFQLLLGVFFSNGTGTRPHRPMEKIGIMSWQGCIVNGSLSGVFLDCSDATKSHELLYMDFMFCC